MGKTVGDVMKRQVRTIHCQKSVAEVGAFLAQHRISGAPMVSTEGQILGVVSLSDITRFCAEPWRGEPGTTMVYEIGTPVTITVEEETAIEEAAAILVRERIHRLVVVKNERPVGILTTLDIVELVARKGGCEAFS